MDILNKRQPILLFLGDVAVLIISLWVTLGIRFREWPSYELFSIHFLPFLILSLIWTVSFFIAGLYETHRVIIRNRLPEVIIKTQIANSIIAITYFYFIPSFGISPKVTLTIYIIVSLVLIVAWRILSLYIFVSKQKSEALLLGKGSEAEELYVEVNRIARHNFKFVSRADPDSLSSTDFQKELMREIEDKDIEIIVLDSSNEHIKPFLQNFYSLIFSKVQFIDFHKLYGEVFYKMPIDLLTYRWFIQNISATNHALYDMLKRAMDIVISIPAAIIFAPFILAGAIALKIQDGGEIFSIQNRVGQFGKNVRLIKLRTMLFNDDGKWKEEGKFNEVTRVGAFLRKTRIDELPQIINVLKGDVSLIGPRPEFPLAVNEYTEAVPYYNARHIIKPGLSGWAQIYHDEHPHHDDPEKVRKTKDKLSFDLYYIKNRSIVLDIMIALKTIKTFISREGR